ncbi:MAG: Vancomycin B-type resistance protein VanW [candidate division WS2 bacterium ADurb.Bin280]|uniref:Vancomycin B-type resistance protein VanW n=1 Tax=candidate division WS2 bacterium ADurb.Bin280 TaxID=1852829 RepID=A0A1V5SD45_9BACT|nr:MAG: Vancomycin B-type resistance protein VanW [candidate division WS2 bacterium ADurb.Bin280]
MKKVKKNNRRLLLIKVVVTVSLVLVVTIGASLIAYAKDYQDKVLPKIFFLEDSISGETREQLKEKVASKNNELKDRKIVIKVSEKNFESKFSEIGWSLNEEEIVEKAYAIGHESSTVKNLASLLMSLFSKKEVAIDFSFNEKQAEDWLMLIEQQVGKPKTEANVIVRNKKATIVEPVAGRGIDEARVKAEIFKRLSIEGDGEIVAELIDDQPTISREEAQSLSSKALELVASNLELSGPKGKATWSSNTLGSMIQLVKREKEGGFLGEKEYEEPYVSFSKTKISSMLESQGEDFNIDPVEAKFAINDGVVSIQVPSQSGEMVDIDKASDVIISILESGKREVLKLPSKVQEPSIKARESSDITKYGIKELIGSATTTFTGSSSNRVHNVKTGVQAVSGVLLKPGEEFSTTGRLGRVDASTGYLQEMVIKEDKTVPEFGGGLCQVSTTLFRAAMNSGLKITERHNHSYRVSYYEPPIGMDATIYTPSPDLKFVNNTPSYILIQGRVEGYKATFDFYGTKDGREIEISEPYVYDQVPAPENVYIDDPSLAPGEEKRIDRAHPGAKATFTYQVKKNGELIVDQKFSSSYVPWPAKYLRGPAKEEGNEGSQE